MRFVNWLEHTSRSLSSSFPELHGKRAEYITQRLSVLLLERLPSSLGRQILALLPMEVLSEDFDELLRLRISRDDSKGDFAIGYPDFVEQISHSFVGEVKPEYSDERFRRIADVFLWAVAQEFSSDLKYQLAAFLPVDIRSRMNLYGGGSDQSQVA